MALELINTYNFTGGVADTGTTIDGVFTSDYDNYEIYLSGADGGTAERVVIIRLINSSGIVSTSTYYSSQLLMGNVVASTTGRFSAQTSSRRFFVLSSSVEGGGAKINIYNPFDSNYRTQLHYRTGDGVLSGLRHSQGIIIEETQQSITGIHFFMDSTGTIDNLDVSVFGVK